MTGITRDTWRAVLVVAVVWLLRLDAGPQKPPPTVETGSPPAHTARHPSVETAAAAHPMGWSPQPPPPAWQQQWQQQWQQPQPQVIIQREQDRPLRRVAAALTEVGDSLIGVIR